jgi:ribonuclease P protein component
MADTKVAATASVSDYQDSPVLFPKLDRLRTRADFQRLTRTGRKHAARGLVLQVAPRPAASMASSTTKSERPRVGFTASKKVGNAVARNRAKRRLRALAHDVLRHKGQPSLDYVLVGRHTTLTRPWPKLVEDLETALMRTRIEDEQA